MKEFIFPTISDMNKTNVDDQSVITYLMSLNKVMPEEIPESPPEIAVLKEEILKGLGLDFP